MSSASLQKTANQRPLRVEQMTPMTTPCEACIVFRRLLRASHAGVVIGVIQGLAEAIERVLDQAERRFNID